MTETQKKIYQIALEEHDHDGLECQLCGLLVEVGFLPDYEPEQEELERYSDGRKEVQ